MAVEFLSDQQAAQYAAFNGAPSRAELERYFFLDDSDLEKVQAKRRAYNRLGSAVQLTSVRYLGRFMPDARQVPAEVAEYLAEQLGHRRPVVSEGVRRAGRGRPVRMPPRLRDVQAGVRVRTPRCAGG